MTHLLVLLIGTAAIFWGALTLSEKNIAEYKRGYADAMSTQKQKPEERNDPECKDRRKPKVVQRLQQPKGD
jgi:hypothetical protein